MTEEQRQVIRELVNLLRDLRLTFSSEIDDLRPYVAAEEHAIAILRASPTEADQRDAARWRAVRDDPRLQGSRNGYATFTKTVDAAMALSPDINSEAK